MFRSALNSSSTPYPPNFMFYLSCKKKNQSKDKKCQTKQNETNKKTRNKAKRKGKKRKICFLFMAWGQSVVDISSDTPLDKTHLPFASLCPLFKTLQ